MARSIFSLAAVSAVSLTVLVWMPTAPAAQRKVAVTPVFQSSNCAGEGKKPSLQYFAAPGAARTWVEAQTGTPISRGSPVYLPPDLVFVGLSMGEHASTGYGVSVEHTAVLNDDGALLLQVHWAVPKADDQTLKMRTSPCLLVGLPERDYRVVRAVDQKGRVRAKSAKTRND